MTEEWRPVVGFETLAHVSSHGRVRSAVTLQLFPQRLLKGYPGVTINGAPRNKRLFTVHSLVAAAFIGPRPTPKHQVNHKDGLKTNNALQNLEYATSKENINHSWNVLGNSRYGEDNPAAKLTVDEVRKIRSEYVPRKMGFHRLAKKFGVSQHLIVLIIQRKKWAAA